jgi:hypothetical protein
VTSEETGRSISQTINFTQLDYVIVSVHTSFALSEAAMTNRIIKAISNPYASILITSGPSSANPPATRVDIPAIIQAAPSAHCYRLNASRDASTWTGGGHLQRQKGVKCAISQLPTPYTACRI